MTNWHVSGQQQPGDPFGGYEFGGQQFGAPPLISAPPPQVQEANTLATLSVVFAFIFAPAGAALGHLGLNQIKRTGQPGRNRAIIGLTLSYTIIVALILALILWLALRDSSPSSSGVSSARPSQAKSAPIGPPPPPCGKGVPVPPQTGGRTFTESDLSGLLLSPSEIRETQGTNLQPLLTDLAAQAPRTEFLTSPYPDGTVEPAGCAMLVTAGTVDAYRDSGYESTYLTTARLDSASGSASFTQVATMFPDATSAHRALARYIGKIPSFDERVTFTFHPNSGSAIPYIMGLNDISSYGDVPQQYFKWIVVPQNYNSEKSTDLYNIDRVLLQNGNVLIDISALGIGNLWNTSAYAIALRITQKLK